MKNINSLRNVKLDLEKARVFLNRQLIKNTELKKYPKYKKQIGRILRDINNLEDEIIINHLL